MATAIAVKDLALGMVINVSFHGGPALPGITGGKVTGLVQSDSVNQTTAQMNHANIYPAIPNPHNEIMNDFRSYDYVVIKKSNGAIVEAGIPWILPSSLQRVDSTLTTIVIQDMPSSLLTEALATIRNLGGNIVSSTTKST